MRFGDRVQETTATTGTSSYSLAGAVAGHRTFVAGIGAAALVGYVATDGTDWEVGYGTLSSGPDTLTRTVLASSNGGSAVNWSAGSKNIYSAPIASVFQSLLTTHKGSSRPAWARAGLTWIDDSAAPVRLRYYDGSADITLGRIDETNDRFISEGAKGANIASASSIDIGAATGDLVHVTGTTTITALGTADAGVERTLVFDGALTLTHNATSLILAGGANITTAAGDSVVMRSEGSGNWKMVGGVRASGAAWVAPAVLAAPTRQVFTSSGTWTKPAGCRWIKVIVTAGGGGGGGASGATFNLGAAGGGGATAIEWLDATALTTVAVTVGAAGTAGNSSGGNGGNGGTSSFGAHAVAGGGFGGGGATGGDKTIDGGLGGTASAGDIQTGGGAGASGVISGARQPGGPGGASYWGGGGRANSGNGLAYGAGGGGGIGNGDAGGAGGIGIVVVEEFY